MAPGKGKLNDSAHTTGVSHHLLPESMEDSGRVGEAPGHAGFVLMQLSALWNPGGWSSRGSAFALPEQEKRGVLCLVMLSSELRCHLPFQTQESILIIAFWAILATSFC